MIPVYRDTLQIFAVIVTTISSKFLMQRRMSLPTSFIISDLDSGTIDSDDDGSRFNYVDRNRGSLMQRSVDVLRDNAMRKTRSSRSDKEGRATSRRSTEGICLRRDLAQETSGEQCLEPRNTDDFTVILTLSIGNDLRGRFILAEVSFRAYDHT